MNDEERLSSLNEAMELLLKAADEIESSIHMTGLEKRFGDLPGRIRTAAISNKEDSVKNLIKELEYRDEEHPGWTRPFASPKYITRKDI